MKKTITFLLTMLLLLGLGQVGNATTYTLTETPVMGSIPYNHTFDFTIPANEVIDTVNLQVILSDDLDLTVWPFNEQGTEYATIIGDGTTLINNQILNDGIITTTTFNFDVLTLVATDKQLNLTVQRGTSGGDFYLVQTTLTAVTHVLPVPLPPSVLLLGSGLMGLGLLGWRRRRSG
jgi:hypothetical protein